MLSRIFPSIALEHVNDVREDHQADDGKKHQDENIQHGEQGAGGAGAAGLPAAWKGDARQRAASSLASPCGSAAASSPPSQSTARSAQDGEMMPELTEPLSSRQAENKGINTGGRMELQPRTGRGEWSRAPERHRLPAGGLLCPCFFLTQTAAQFLGVLMVMRLPVCSWERAHPMGKEAKLSFGHRKALSIGVDCSELSPFGVWRSWGAAASFAFNATPPASVPFKAIWF